MKEKFKIDFICTGNSNRSRMAEAYLASLEIDDIQVSSSGIKASRNLDGPICWYTQKIIKENNLIKYESPIWTQTTSEILTGADLIIFMKNEHLKYCRKNFDYQTNNFEVWNIDDVGVQKNDLEVINRTRQIYKQIVYKTNDYVSRRI